MSNQPYFIATHTATLTGTDHIVMVKETFHGVDLPEKDCERLRNSSPDNRMEEYTKIILERDGSKLDKMRNQWHTEDFEKWYIKHKNLGYRISLYFI